MDFQVVRDKQDRDEYRAMKKTIIAQFNLEKSIRNRDTFINIQKTAVSLLAVGIPGSKKVAAKRTTLSPGGTSSRRGSTGVPGENLGDMSTHIKEQLALEKLSHPERLKQLRLHYREQDKNHFSNDRPVHLFITDEDGHAIDVTPRRPQRQYSPKCSPASLTVLDENIDEDNESDRALECSFVKRIHRSVDTPNVEPLIERSLIRPAHHSVDAAMVEPLIAKCLNSPYWTKSTDHIDL